MKMKLTLLLIFSGLWLQGQSFSYTEKEASDKPIFQELMKQPEATLEDVQHAFELFAAKHPGKYKQYYRWLTKAQLLQKSDGTQPSAEEIEQAYKNFKKNTVVSRSVTSNWTEDGPIAMPTNDTGQPNGLGRVNEIALQRCRTYGALKN